MNEKPTVILVTEPDDLKPALSCGALIAHMAYRIGSNGHLLRNGVAMSSQGGLMVLSDAGAEGINISFSNLVWEISRECKLRYFSGVVADFNSRISPVLSDLIITLSEELSQRKLKFYISEEYASVSSRATVMISSAISGGSLDIRLSEASAKYGNRLALEIQRNCEDFKLPSPDGAGKQLSLAELSSIISLRSPSVFFSSELCTHYFTYKDDGGFSHFVLFDNAGSIRKKIACAQRHGINEAFILFPEVSDIVDKIMKPDDS